MVTIVRVGRRTDLVSSDELASVRSTDRPIRSDVRTTTSHRPTTTVDLVTRQRSTLFDALIVVGLGLLTVASWALTDDFDDPAGDFRDLNVWFWVLQAAQIVPLMARRHFPVAVISISGFAIMIASIAQFETSPAQFGVVIALYSVAAYASRTDALISLAVAFVAILISIVSSFDGAEGFVVIVSNYVIFGTAWLLGDWVRSRRENLVALEERARRLEADRTEAEARAARRERNRIARELHDIVAHSLSVMVIHAGAVRRDLERDDAARAERVRTIEETGRATLAEMRHLLGRIRTDDDIAPLAPQPGLADLETLVANFEAAGLRVTLDLVSTPGVELTSTIGMSTYRIVQESLTNALKHAGPADVKVEVEVGDGGVTISVVDDGRGAAADHTEPGHGLVGIRERVGLFDGQLRAGPRIGGGWAVRAELPLDDSHHEVTS